jgi:uncharacterized protein (DUF58 family)
MPESTRPPIRNTSTPSPPGWLKPWRSRYRRWLDRRIPPARRITLNQKNLFILPGFQGGAYLFVTLLVWIGATNFQNNLILALCFLLLAILFVAIHQTFANLSGLTLRFIDAEPVFAGKVAHCKFSLESSTDRQQLEFQWPGEAAVIASHSAKQASQIEIPITTHQRGRFKPGRFRLQSGYPLGIIRCWSWLDLDAEILVYPTPLKNEIQPSGIGDPDAGDERVAGSEDFFSLRGYIPGDSLSRVAWKHYAAGRGLQVRETVDYLATELWLDFHALADSDPEIRLSKLCFSALELSAEQRPFGLKLPHLTLEPDSGSQHLQATLRALAECPV